MHALFFKDVVSVRDVPRPDRPPGRARVRVRRARIGDTRLQRSRGYLGYNGVLGQEFVSKVLECDDAKWQGKRVAAEINAGRGACEDRMKRDGHHGGKRTVRGILRRDRALAEARVIPERCLVEVPNEVSDEKAVFAEPFASPAGAARAFPSAGFVDAGRSSFVVNERQLIGSRCGNLHDAIGSMLLRIDATPSSAARDLLTEGVRAFEHAATRGTLEVLVDPSR